MHVVRLPSLADALDEARIGITVGPPGDRDYVLVPMQPRGKRRQGICPTCGHEILKRNKLYCSTRCRIVAKQRRRTERLVSAPYGFPLQEGILLPVTLQVRYSSVKVCECGRSLSAYYTTHCCTQCQRGEGHTHWCDGRQMRGLELTKEES